MSDDEIRIEAWFAAEPASVFDAWTNPQQLGAWFAAGDWRVTNVDFQPVADYRWRIDFVHPDGSKYSEAGRVISVMHAKRLEFTLKQMGLDLPAAETSVVVTFDAKNDGTVILFLQTGFGADATRRDSNDAGWRSCFEKLKAVLATE